MKILPVGHLLMNYSSKMTCVCSQPVTLFLCRERERLEAELAASLPDQIQHNGTL